VPLSHDPVAGAQTLCELREDKGIVPCPPCPADLWLVLATLTFACGTAGDFKIDVRTNRRILLQRVAGPGRDKHCLQRSRPRFA